MAATAGERFALPDRAGFAAYSKPSDVFFFASSHEANYPSNVAKITVRGGSTIAVAGGMEHNFAYWVACRPDKIALYDVNSWAIKVAKAKCELVPACESFEDFSRRFHRIFTGKERFAFPSLSPADMRELVAAGSEIARSAGSLTPHCDCDNGWDTPEQFEALRRIVTTTEIRYLHGNILDASFEGGTEIALVFVSDIFGLLANIPRRAEFVERLQEGRRGGMIREDAQIIDSMSEKRVLSVEEFIQTA